MPICLSPWQLPLHLLGVGPGVLAPPGVVHCPPGCGKAQEAGPEAGRGPPGWGDGLGRTFHREQQDVGSAVGLGLGCPVIVLGAQAHNSFMSLRTTPPVLAHAAESLHPRAGCGPGKSLAASCLPQASGSIVSLKGIPPQVCALRLWWVDWPPGAQERF